MRRVFLILIVAIYAYSNSLSYDEIAQMVEKIKQKREGIGVEELNGTPNPFTIVKVKKVVKKVKKAKEKKRPKIVKIVEPTYTLTAIFNSKAFINGKWYGLKDKIGDYRVVFIGDDSVVISNPRATKRLKIESNIKKINLFGGGDKR